jgi:hypothetical protein
MSAKNRSLKSFWGKPKESIFCTVPCMRGVLTAETAWSLLQLTSRCNGANIPIAVHLNPEPRPHGWERNDAAADFLASSYSHHLLIDDDVGFDPESIIQMLRSGCALIGCAYPIRKLPTRVVVRTFDKAGAIRFADNKGSPPLRVSEIGTGCMLIRRDVYETIAKTAPKYERAPFEGEMRTEFFRFDSVRSDGGGPLQELPEDHYFCRLARAAGFDVHVMTTMQSVCVHVGRYVYDVSSAMRPVEGAEAAE